MKTLIVTLAAAGALLTACGVSPENPPAPTVTTTDSQAFLDEWERQLTSPPEPTTQPTTWEDLLLPGWSQQIKNHSK